MIVFSIVGQNAGMVVEMPQFQAENDLQFGMARLPTDAELQAFQATLPVPSETVVSDSTIEESEAETSEDEPEAPTVTVPPTVPPVVTRRRKN